MHPRRTLFRRAGAIALLMVAVLVGHLTGQQRATRWGIGLMRAEANANLMWRIEALALIRTGQTDRAVEGLEAQADNLAVVIAQNGGGEALALAKAYREAVPPPDSRSAELSAVFAALPETKMEWCSPALQRLLAQD